MSYYVFGPETPYKEYLQQKVFHDESISTINSLNFELSKQARSLIASNDAISRENMQINENILKSLGNNTEIISEAINENFDRISCELQDISFGISNLNSTFHWGFCQLIASIGNMGDRLSDLIKVSKTPAQTAAYEQFEIARDAFRQELYTECLEAVEKAINGDHTSPGYKLEWRFYNLVGVLKLGFVNSDVSLIDLFQAEDNFLKAARYARKDFPQDAGKALLYAGWAAFCNGKLDDALKHTEEAITILENNGEAIFQKSKILMALNKPTEGLKTLKECFELDERFLLKAAADGNFQNYHIELDLFLEQLRQDLLTKFLSKYEYDYEKFIHTINHFRDNLKSTCQGVKAKCESVFKEIRELSIFDINYYSKIKNFTAMVNDCLKRQRIEGGISNLPAFFERLISEATSLTSDYNYIAIEQGLYRIGDDNGREDEKPSILIFCDDFELNAYQVTQKQWYIVMGDNPSKFKDENAPVTNVSFHDVNIFFEKLNEDKENDYIYMLPTEAEWEIACRSNQEMNYCYGNDFRILKDYAWYSENAKSIRPVGMRFCNESGFFDMHGNVCEWCSDWYSQFSYREAKQSYSSDCTVVEKIPIKKSVNRKRKRPVVKTREVKSIIEREEPINLIKRLCFMKPKRTKHEEIKIEEFTEYIEEEYIDEIEVMEEHERRIIAIKNPKGHLNGTERVARGGSFLSDAKSCRSATRFKFSPNLKNEYLGFRIARKAKREDSYNK